MTLPTRAMDDGSVEVDVFEAIGAHFGGITTRHVAILLKEAKGKPLHVRINSPGGEALEGAAIHNLLASHDGDVTIDVIGLAASAASVIAMAGKRVRMAENALMMIHDPWNICAGNAEAMRKVADNLDKDAEGLVTSYTRKTGKSPEEVRAMMRAETFFTAREAVEHGFADEVIEDATPAAACVRPEHLPIFGGELPEPLKAFVVTEPSAERIESTRRAGFASTTTLGASVETHSVASGVARGVSEKPKGDEPVSNETPTMPMPAKILVALALSEDADEAAVISAVNRMKASAEIGREVEQLTGQTGKAAVGAVRALKETAASHDELQAQVAKIECNLHRRDFDAAIDGGLKGPRRKLNPALAKHWNDKFEKAVSEGRAADCVAELQGFLAVAPPLVGPAYSQPSNGGGGDFELKTSDGKSWGDLNFSQRALLKRDNPDLFAAMRDDAKAKGQL